MVLMKSTIISLPENLFGKLEKYSENFPSRNAAMVSIIYSFFEEREERKKSDWNE